MSLDTHEPADDRAADGAPLEKTPVDETADAQAPADDVTEEDERERERAAHLEGRVEALLFSSEVPLPARRLAEIVRADKHEVLETIDRLNVFYGDASRAFRISPIAGGFQMVTTADHADVLASLQKEKVPSRLSQAALETLSIIAFKQPVTRAEIDSIRGVTASDRVLRHLIERKVVRIAGRAEAPGRPLLYGTTREFLAYFGLGKLGDLPRPDELKALLAGEIPAEALKAEGFAEDEGDDSAGEGDPTMEGAPASSSDPSQVDGEAASIRQDASGDEGDFLAEEFSDESRDSDERPDEAKAGTVLEASESHSVKESDDRSGVTAP